jgi:hypothetical protein
MKLPDQVELPFFSYGLFRPGQIGFGRLRHFVAGHEAEWHVKGSLLDRDGLPVLDRGDQAIPGVLIRFHDGTGQAAYEIISGIEPDKLYRWDLADVHKDVETVKANLLMGRKPKRGSHPFEGIEWDGSKEPLFDSALQVVAETLEQNRQFEWDLKPLFRLQMAYMLLWTAIERFAAFKYHLGERATDKVNQLALEPTFVAGLAELVKEKREVFRTDDPETKAVLDPNDPEKALAYYYQVRSNIVHRGKAATTDHWILVNSLEELSELFRRVLLDEFSRSA